MILGFHCIFTAYGFWLPNEPRGSWSTFVGSWDLLQFGPATKTNTRQSLAGHAYDHTLKQQMQAKLKYPPVRFTGQQARVIGQTFRELPYVIHALAVMPDHVHVVFACTPCAIGRVVGHVKTQATQNLRQYGWFTQRSPWARGAWHVYLNDETDMIRALRYVQANPSRSSLKPQHWSAVQPYAEKAHHK